MSDQQQNESTEMNNLANQLFENSKNIILIYAFNGTGKTRLSMEYKDVTKESNGGDHLGVYYNAYSEDLFYWDNDNENDGADIRLRIQKSSLNQYHASLDEKNLREKLSPYKPKYDFKFKFYNNTVDGIESIQFVLNDENSALPSDDSIKISRGEEQSFIWCFFLSLFDIQGWTGKQSGHFFIDDPVSSLDDHNIFVTAATLYDLIETHFKSRKIIITTHHIGFFSTLADWLTKGEKSEKFKKFTQLLIMKKDMSGLALQKPDGNVFLFHLHLLQTLERATHEQLYAYHFVLLRQVLENIASFLGVGQFAYVLREIGITDVDQTARIINVLSHRNVFRYEAKALVPDNEALFRDIFTRLKIKYNFVLHEGEQ